MSISKRGRTARSRRVARRVYQLPLTRLGAGAGVLALAMSGLFGGLDPAEKPGLPTVKLDAVDEGEPWNVKVTGVRVVGDQLQPLKLKNANDRWVAVLATVEVTADETRSDLQDVLLISGVDGLLSKKAGYVYLLRDATTPVELNPAMPEKLAFIWEQKAGAAVPTKAGVEIWGKTLRKDNLAGSLAWLDPAPRARVVDVPVQDRRTS